MNTSTKSERELAEAIAPLVVAAAAIDGTAGAEPIIADALATQRAKIGSLVNTIVEGLTAPGCSMQKLAKMREGWTPLQVRELINECERARMQHTEARELLARVFRGEP